MGFIWIDINWENHSGLDFKELGSCRILVGLTHFPNKPELLPFGFEWYWLLYLEGAVS